MLIVNVRCLWKFRLTFPCVHYSNKKVTISKKNKTKILYLFSNSFHFMFLIIGGSKGGRQGHTPGGSKFFHFHAVFSKNLKNYSNFGSWRPLEKIRDPPLLMILILQYNCKRNSLVIQSHSIS